MWHALRAELAYSRPWLLGGLGIAVGVAIILSVVFFAVGDDDPPSHVKAGLRAMFLIMAPMIVGFIVQAYRSEERRARLLLTGPLTPLQLAGVMVLLPATLFGIGLLAAGLVIGAGFLVTGKLERETLDMVGFIGGQMLTYSFMGLLVQEATAARHQRRLGAAAAGWAGFVVAVLLLAALYLVAALEIVGSQTWITMIVGHLIVAATAMASSVALYAHRTDFTR